MPDDNKHNLPLHSTPLWYTCIEFGSLSRIPSEEQIYHVSITRGKAVPAAACPPNAAALQESTKP